MSLKYDDTDKSIAQLFNEIGLGARGEWSQSGNYLLFRMGNWVYGCKFYFHSKVVQFPRSCPSDVRKIAREAILYENTLPKETLVFRDSHPPQCTPEERALYEVKELRHDVMQLRMFKENRLDEGVNK